LQGINDDGLRGVIRRFIGPTGNADRAIGGIIVWPVPLVKVAVQRGLLSIPQRLVNQRKIIMGGHIL
jgi:hypothetical protein